MPIDLGARIDAMVQQVTQGGADEGGSSVTESGQAPGEGSSGGDAGTSATVNTIAAAPAAPTTAADVNAARAALIQERLAQQRENRKSAKLAAETRAERAAAAEDRKAAAAERGKWEALKHGTFKEGIAATGRDPLVVFNEMQREAIEASTPEAEIKRMRADFEKQMGEKLAPLQETIEQLKADKAQAVAREQQQVLTSAFMREAQDPEFVSLRVEYEDTDLFGYVKDFVDNPDTFEAAAEAYGVALTDPASGFTMREILTVLKKAQDAHDQGKTARNAKLRPSDPNAASSAPTRTVNGTAERRNAGTTIGPDLEGERAAPPPKLTRSQRVQAEVDRLNRR